MSFAPDPWSNETPWGLTGEACIALQEFLRLLREKGALNVEALDHPLISECINRGVLAIGFEDRSPLYGYLPVEPPSDKPVGGDMWVRVTERGQAVLEGLSVLQSRDKSNRRDKFVATLERFLRTYPRDDRPAEERLERLMELKRRQGELTRFFTDLFFEMSQLRPPAGRKPGPLMQAEPAA